MKTRPKFIVAAMLAGLFVLLWAGGAFATTPAPADPSASSDQQQDQDQQQGQEQDQRQQQQQGQDVQNEYRSRTSAIALSLPGLVAAPAASGTCLVHSRGWGAFSVGATGGTKLDPGCVKMNNCMAMADRLAAWGQLPAAMAQLQSCGAVPAEFVPPALPPAASAPSPAAPAPDLSGLATKGDVAALDEKMNRIFRQTVGK